jgi:rubrerythrin
MKFKTADEVLDFAIDKEQDAADLYNRLAADMKFSDMKAVFSGFAKEELGHKAKLEVVKAGKKLEPSAKKIQDLKIGDTLVAVDPSEGEMDYQKALILAMKAEKAAFKLYTDLSEATDSAELKELFLALAQEEAKHKLRFEIEYDDRVLTEN